MKKALTRLLIACLALLAPAAASAQETLPSLAVMADASLSLPLAEITRNYARARRSAVALGMVDAQEGARLIAEGATADVLITARDSWLEQLRQQGLVDIYSEAQVTRGNLVLVSPPGVQLPLSLESGFPTGPLLLAMGTDPLFIVPHPETLPEGGAAREALRKMEADADLEPYTVYLRSRRQIERQVREQRAYGLMLGSEAKRLGMRVIADMPQRAYTPILYRSVVLAGEKMAEARKFTEYLKSPEAQEVFIAYGFFAP